MPLAHRAVGAAFERPARARRTILETRNMLVDEYMAAAIDKQGR
jgi:hypothetical protein